MKPKILSLPSVDKKYRTDESNSADLVNCQFLPREPKKARESRPKNEKNFARVLVCPEFQFANSEFAKTQIGFSNSEIENTVTWGFQSQFCLRLTFGGHRKHRDLRFPISILSQVDFWWPYIINPIYYEGGHFQWEKTVPTIWFIIRVDLL